MVMVAMARCLYEAIHETVMEMMKFVWWIWWVQQEMCCLLCHSRGASLLFVRHSNALLFYSVNLTKRDT